MDVVAVNQFRDKGSNLWHSHNNWRSAVSNSVRYLLHKFNAHSYLLSHFVLHMYIHNFHQYVYIHLYVHVLLFLPQVWSGRLCCWQPVAYRSQIIGQRHKDELEDAERHKEWAAGTQWEGAVCTLTHTHTQSITLKKSLVLNQIWDRKKCSFTQISINRNIESEYIKLNHSRIGLHVLVFSVPLRISRSVVNMICILEATGFIKMFFVSVRSKESLHLSIFCICAWEIVWNLVCNEELENSTSSDLFFLPTPCLT